MKRRAFRSELRPPEWRPEAVTTLVEVAHGRHREAKRIVPISVPRVRFLETPADKWDALDRRIAARITTLRNEGQSSAY